MLLGLSLRSLVFSCLWHCDDIGCKGTKIFESGTSGTLDLIADF